MDVQTSNFTLAPSSPILFPERFRHFRAAFDCKTPSKAFSPSEVIPLAEKLTSSAVWDAKQIK